MESTMDQVLVIICVVIAALFLSKKIIFKSKSKGCSGCGCGKSSTAPSKKP